MDLLFGNNRVRAFKNKLKDDSDYFPHFPWQLVQLMEKIAGFWPYQNKLKQCCLQLLHFFAFFSIFLAVANKMREYVGVNTEMVLECLLILAFLTGLFLKLLFACLYQRSRKIIYEKVAEQFKTIADPDEAIILRQFADQGFRYIAIYIFISGIIVCTFDGIPIIQSYYNYYFVTSELSIKFPIEMDYGFNHGKYWYAITIDFLLFVVSGFIVDLAYDLSFILQIRHVQAIFKIVGMRLNKAAELVSEVDDVDEATADAAYLLISSAIDLHSECLELVDMIENNYTISWFIILLINTASFTASTHLVSLRLHDKVETIRIVAAYTLLLMHFHVIFSQGQRITDSSEEVTDFCYYCKWYNLPIKSRKLLIVMMIRTSIPCQITGAQFFSLSIKTFGVMLKAGVSYYTIFEA